MKNILLIASGDARYSANTLCWPTQRAMEEQLCAVIGDLGYKAERACGLNEEGHGFINSQRYGMEVFRSLDPELPLIVAESVWQYSHHILAGLTTHRGPILTVANWSGQWPGLVGMLNLNGSLTKAGVAYSTLWSEDFENDSYFREKLGDWLNTGKCGHDLRHVTPLEKVPLSVETASLGKAQARKLKSDKAIMGVFDEGCMGMFNAIIPDHLLNPCGVFKERLSQSALFYETQNVSDREAREVYQWYIDAGMKFHFGSDSENELTEDQVIDQCRMYIAAVRLAHDFGCESIGIQYQLGLKDLLPASDLVEGTLNSTKRPPVFSKDGGQELYPGRAIPHFNEVDECAGLDAMMIHRINRELGEPVETTLHDIRWGDWDLSRTTEDYVWVFEISGAVPAEHNGGWDKSHGYRQAKMYFAKGGSTLSGISKAGEMVWSRIYVENNALNMDIGRGEAIDLPMEECKRRLDSTTAVWPLMNAVIYGVSRDQIMAKHKANHIQVVYGSSAEAADKALCARAAMASELNIKVNLCGTRKGGVAWSEK
jgi:L-fucose isomerase-like protein